MRTAASSSAEALAFQLEMLDRMEQLGRAKSDFVSKISHELRSPLTSVIGYVELLIDGGPGEPSSEQNRMLTIVERNSRRLLALIEDLLTMSRVEAGTFELEVDPVDLARGDRPRTRDDRARDREGRTAADRRSRRVSAS